MDRFQRLRRVAFLVICSTSLLLFSCHRGTGCPGEDAQVKLDRKGNPKAKAKSGLFDKKTQKKMKN
ncbi:MAG: hypothetical protein M3Q56_13185 [Bacteroidota bacterium]|nr:hypothetical protein [Bacteroidota bacterium]